jgi:hypothetical protein
MTPTPNHEPDDTGEEVDPGRPPAEGGRDEVDADPGRRPRQDPPAPHADPAYDLPGDNPLAAEDDDD